MMTALLSPWTFLVILALLWNISDLYSKTDEMASNSASIIYDMDIGCRRWNSLHGEVYVQINSTTPPNPYLALVREKYIVSPFNSELTLINPLEKSATAQITAWTDASETSHEISF